MPLETAALSRDLPPWFPDPLVPVLGQKIGLHRRVTQTFHVSSKPQHMVWDLMVPLDYPGDQFRQDLLTDTFTEWWEAGLLGFPPARIFFTSGGSWTEFLVHIPKLGERLAFLLESAISIGLLGGTDQPPLPPNCTIAVGLTTGFPGPSLRGRKFYPGLVDTAHDPNDVGYLRPLVCGDLTGCFFGLVSAFLELAIHWNEGWAICLYNPLRPDFGGGYPRGLVPVNGCRMSDNTLDSQWRRTPRHHRHGKEC